MSSKRDRSNKHSPNRREYDDDDYDYDDKSSERSRKKISSIRDRNNQTWGNISLEEGEVFCDMSKYIYY
jgi:hypothetical protein